MKTPALAVLFLAVLMTGVLGADAPAPAVPAAPPPATPIAPAAPTEAAKPPPDFVLVINVTPPGPGKAGDNLHFEIGVASRTGKFPADAVGTLEVFDPEERILTSDIQAETDGKVLIYTFDLSPRYLGKSRFSFKGTGADLNGKSVADVLWVTLKDYVNKSLQ